MNKLFQDSCFNINKEEPYVMIQWPLISRDMGFCVSIFIKSKLFLTPKETLRMDVLMIKKLCEISRSIKNEIVNINSSKG